MNSIFVVTENLIAKDYTIKATDNSSYILKAFKTKRQAFEFIEQLYYADMDVINMNNSCNISNICIENNVVYIRGFKKLYNGFTNEFLCKYRIQEIPFE